MTLLFALAFAQASVALPTGDEILARVEAETSRRHIELKDFSAARQYTMKNLRFGKQSATSVRADYAPVAGDRFTILVRSGSSKLNSIIDDVLASEVLASVAPESARHEISAANYRVRLLGTEVAGARSCYVLELKPKFKSRSLIVGKAWVDPATYSIVRIEGQFAASLSSLVGAPRITEDFTEVLGFWLPAHLTSVASSFLLGITELEIVFSNYQLTPLNP